MDFNDLTFLTKFSSIVQIAAIILIFLGGILQGSRFYIDKRINILKDHKAQIERHIADSTIIDLQSTISTQVQKIEEQTFKVESSRQKVEQQSAEIEDQKQRIAEAESRIRPRTINDQIFNELRAELSKHAAEKIEITSLMGDADALSLASRLKSLFQSAGWEVNGVNQTLFISPIKGIIILFKDESKRDKAEYIFRILNYAKFHSVGEINPQSEFDLRLVIGSRE